MKKTLFLNDAAEAVYYVTRLPADTEVVTDIPKLLVALDTIGDKHKVTMVDWSKRRKLFSKKPIYVLTYLEARNRKIADVLVGKKTRMVHTKLFVNKNDFWYCLINLSPGVTLSSNDMNIINLVSGYRKDIWLTTDTNHILSIPVITGKCFDRRYDAEERTVFYIASTR